MANVFISHSSLDKPFVRRLALGLMAEGIPVWVDSWRLEIGDSLLDKIYEGIDESSIVVLVMSQSATNSGWVNRELNAALSKEEQTGRNFLIPIRTDDCAIPLKIADRLYADFSSPGKFSEPLSKLVEVLVSKGCRDLPVAQERDLLGLSFTQAVHLDTTSLQRALGHLRKRHVNLALKARQIVVNDDPEYEFLLKRLHYNIDNIASLPNYSAEAEQYLRSTLGEIEALQKWLAEGVAALVSQRKPMNAAYWFAKLLRGRMVFLLWSAQRTDAPKVLEYGRDWRNAALTNNESAAAFFETGEVDAVDIYRAGDEPIREYFHMWIDKKACSGLRSSDGGYEGPRPYYDVYGPSEEDKYVFPQMLLRHFRFPERSGEPIWDLGNAVIGLH
jgi:hypothetical protein